MKAILAGQNGAVLGQASTPVPKPNEVLVRVRACGLNRADLGMAAGHRHGAHGGAGTVLGMEWAGEVVEIERVFARPTGRGAVPAPSVAPAAPAQCREDRPEKTLCASQRLR